MFPQDLYDKAYNRCPKIINQRLHIQDKLCVTLKANKAPTIHMSMLFFWDNHPLPTLTKEKLPFLTTCTATRN